MSTIVLSTAYLPPVEYFKKIRQANSICIEKHEHYLKQSYRNRCNVLGANGVLSLSIPVVSKHDKEIVTDTKISYAEKWQQQHWRTIESAYRNSPYFIYYADALKPFYQKKYTFLFDFNAELLQLLLNNFKLNVEIKFTETFDKTDSPGNYRYSIHPKIEVSEADFKPYLQLFSDKFPFKPNLSSIDLLFNMGPQAIDYL
ncbi:MAG TPA: WbqC family protein [Bacteroidia bacterium]|nr:WbqC family protein [Bacteroidia bacterium]